MYYDIIGMVGVSCYLLAYFLLQSGRCDVQKDYSYTLLNILGAAFVLISLKSTFNLPSAVSQAVWIVLSCYGMLRVKSTRKTSRRKDPLAQTVYNPEVLEQTDEIYVDDHLAWTNANRSATGRR